MRVLGIGYRFEAVDTEVDALALPLEGLGGGCDWLVAGQVLLRFAAHRSKVDDGSLDCAEKAIGERGQHRRRRWMGFHERAPRSQQTSKYCQRQPCDALCAKAAADCSSAQKGDQNYRDEHKTRPLPEPMSDGNAQCE